MGARALAWVRFEKCVRWHLGKRWAQPGVRQKWLKRPMRRFSRSSLGTNERARIASGERGLSDVEAS